MRGGARKDQETFVVFPTFLSSLSAHRAFLQVGAARFAKSGKSKTEKVLFWPWQVSVLVIQVFLHTRAGNDKLRKGGTKPGTFFSRATGTGTQSSFGSLIANEGKGFAGKLQGKKKLFYAKGLCRPFVAIRTTVASGVWSIQRGRKRNEPFRERPLCYQLYPLVQLYVSRKTSKVEGSTRRRKCYILSQ